ncbi:MAG: 2-oxoacid:ferredoxin oxidoreductase subunit beta [Magnetospirillum sp. WYHS-4]
MDALLDAPRLGPKDYKSDYKPVWCPGCGDYSVLSSVTKALAELEVPREQAAVISGIGCSSRIPAYTSVYGFHGVHGRALALATGLKLARPDLTVLVTGGDGDGFSIGGNHFLHACRRNVDITYIVMDNQVYGMTKGQASPTTASEWSGSKLTPYGTGVSPFQPLAVALSAGANFIARSFSGDPNEVARLIVEAVRHPGFSFLQILSPCVTFRPEQRGWKDAVRPAPIEPTSDPAVAGKRLMSDDGFNTGILYLGNRPAYETPMEAKTSRLAKIENAFSL